jgi:hypothetical protein
MGKPFRECGYCGAHLDAGERCDCGGTPGSEVKEESRRMRLVAICREVDRDTGRIAVYPLDREINSEVLTCLEIRARMNPELRYFTLISTRWEKYGEAITGILKRRTVTRADVERIGGIVEL